MRMSTRGLVMSGLTVAAGLAIGAGPALAAPGATVPVATTCHKTVEKEHCTHHDHTKGMHDKTHHGKTHHGHMTGMHDKAGHTHRTVVRHHPAPIPGNGPHQK